MLISVSKKKLTRGTMAKISQSKLDSREEELARKEYGMEFVDLPGNVKQTLHNAVLEEFGVRRKFKFTCLECGKLFEDMVEGGLVEIYTDIQSETHTEVLQSCCPKCREAKEKAADLAALEAEWK
jgi:5-methylcytosine-specific restriction endonuclease McrA